MLVTVMMPTRQRIELAKRSIASLLDNAHTPGNIEIYVAIDNDDTHSIEYFNSDAWQEFISSRGSSTKIFITEPWGYANLHNYYNSMALQAHGDWLLVWNDDTIMQSQDWDLSVEANRNFVGMLHMVTENYRPKFALFPLIPKVWIELFGAVSLSNSNDSWIHHICLEADAIKIIEPTVFHDRYDLTGNNLDQVYLDRPNQKKKYKSAEMVQLRKQWAEKFLSYKNSLT